MRLGKKPVLKVSSFHFRVTLIRLLMLLLTAEVRFYVPAGVQLHDSDHVGRYSDVSQHLVLADAKSMANCDSVFDIGFNKSAPARESDKRQSR